MDNIITFRIGKLVISNTAMRHDLLIYKKAHKHLIGPFWWRV